MNLYQKGVADALGLKNVAMGNHKQLFYSKDLMKGFEGHWLERKLSTQNVADLLNVDRSTVHRWRAKGLLNGKKTGTRKEGWRKIIFWRHSLQDVESCLQRLQPRQPLDNPVAGKHWTVQEWEMLQNGIRPEYRSHQACRNMKHRLRKEGKLWTTISPTQ